MKNTIDDIAEKGNMLFDAGKYEQAVNVWQKGLDMLAKPLNAQNEAVWFQTSIADAYFMLGDYQTAYSYLTAARSNLSGEGYDPFVMLRLGQCCFELCRDDAREYLLRAYMSEGEEIFDGEDGKYLDAIKDLIQNA